ncbi:MAG: hypothetical protein Q7T18_11635, partial [Sedimentisphaerales bacterium]|nr:hypothetical protein [Sedimentisphaerales bacterium]
MSNPDTQSKTENTANERSSSPVDDLLKYRKSIIIGAHIAVFSVSLMLSFLLITNMQFQADWLVYQYPQLLVAFLFVKMTVFGLFKKFRGWWRYVGISDLINIGKAALVSTIVIVVLWVGVLNIPELRRAMPDVAAVSQGVFILDMFFTILL